MAELSGEASQRVRTSAGRLETATAYGPYALQRLKPGGAMEVVFWEKRILGELGDLQKLRFVDPESGKVYRLELVGHDVVPKSQIAPFSGYGVPIGPHDPVGVARLRKIEVPFEARPSGGRGPLRPGEVVGTHSGRPYFPDRAGGPIRDLDFKKIRISDKGIEAVERHLARFGGGDAEAAMVERLRRISRGELPATDFDRAFYAHELRESVRYRRAGWAVGQPAERGAAYDLWNDLHTATLEDYALRERDKLGRAALFHPDVDPDAPARGPTGARGAPPERGRPIHAWDPDQPLGFRPGERHLPPELRAALEAEVGKSKVVRRAIEATGGSLATLDDDELLAQYNAYRRRLKVERPEVIPRAVAEGLEGVGEGGRCPSWVWVAALRNAGWTGAVADFPGRVAGLIHQLKNPLTGTPLLSYRGSPAALAAHAAGLPPGTQVYISARTKNGVLHALLGVVQPDGLLIVMHGPSGKTRLAAPRPDVEVGGLVRRGPAGELELGSRVYDVKAGDLGAYTDHRWWVLDVPQAPAKQPRIAEHVPTTGKLLAEGEALAPKARRDLEIDLERGGHKRETLRMYDDEQLLAAHAALQIELAPKRVAAFRGALAPEARAALDGLIDAPHLAAAKVEGPMEARLGEALATKVEVDARIPFGEVRVVPDVGPFGIVRGVKVVTGRGATVADVLAHIPTLHEHKRMVGVLGAARRTIDAVNRVLRGGGALPIGSRAHEAWRELQKLPPMIEARLQRLASGELGTLERMQLEWEINQLERQLAGHVSGLGDLRPGRGYVAAEIAELADAEIAAQANQLIQQRKLKAAEVSTFKELRRTVGDDIPGVRSLKVLEQQDRVDFVFHEEDRFVLLVEKKGDKIWTASSGNAPAKQLGETLLGLQQQRVKIEGLDLGVHLIVARSTGQPPAVMLVSTNVKASNRPYLAVVLDANSRIIGYHPVEIDHIKTFLAQHAPERLAYLRTRLTPELTDDAMIDAVYTKARQQHAHRIGGVDGKLLGPDEQIVLIPVDGAVPDRRQLKTRGAFGD